MRRTILLITALTMMLLPTSARADSCNAVVVEVGGSFYVVQTTDVEPGEISVLPLYAYGVPVTTIYEETNGVPGLQRGEINLENYTQLPGGGSTEQSFHDHCPQSSTPDTIIEQDPWSI